MLGQLGINSMALPPVLLHGSEELKRRVCLPVVKGDKHISLAISEPAAGLDVAGLKCTAVRDGDHYVVTGAKKWITGGVWAHYFTTCGACFGLCLFTL